MVSPHSQLLKVTQRVIERSKPTREAYLARIQHAQGRFPARGALSCANLAHGFAGLEGNDKLVIKQIREPNIGIVSSYNEMLSAHAPYKNYPDIIKQAARENGGVAQFAGGVPAMCDGITQGNAGMELSLFSREVIAMSTAVALTHNMFDAALCLGICDKIVPGLLIGALQFGHLPTIFVPAGPMASGLSNDDKARTRQQFATGQCGRDALLEAEAAAYHSHGTCTFYGTANSNQMLMEVMGLHLPGSAFVHPHTPLRDALTAQAARRVLDLTVERGHYMPIGHVVDEKAIVNGIVALLATGGSTNHTLHLVAIARAAGIVIDWDDFDTLSQAVPLLAKIYPNGKADVNHFHAAGGVAFLVRNLLEGGLLHEDVNTVAGKGLKRYTEEPKLLDGKLQWVAGVEASADTAVLRGIREPFQPDGGLRLMQGKLGRGVIKISAVAAQHRKVKAPAIVFDSQEAVQEAFDKGELKRDFIAVVRFQGARAKRHARVASFDAAARCAAGSGFPCRAGDRWPYVGRVGQGAGGHPSVAGSVAARPDRQSPHGRHAGDRRRSGRARHRNRRSRVGRASERRAAASGGQRSRLRPRAVRRVPCGGGAGGAGRVGVRQAGRRGRHGRRPARPRR
ncbi:phosphogluconate dehydratase [Paraburkholderia sp. 40]